MSIDAVHLVGPAGTRGKYSSGVRGAALQGFGKLSRGLYQRTAAWSSTAIPVKLPAPPAKLQGPILQSTFGGLPFEGTPHMPRATRKTVADRQAFVEALRADMQLTLDAICKQAEGREKWPKGVEKTCPICEDPVHGNGAGTVNHHVNVVPGDSIHWQQRVALCGRRRCLVEWALYYADANGDGDEYEQEQLAELLHHYLAPEDD
jgi:hypothetical protein